jgi:hypothetical protein
MGFLDIIHWPDFFKTTTFQRLGKPVKCLNISRTGTDEIQSVIIEDWEEYYRKFRKSGDFNILKHE